MKVSIKVELLFIHFTHIVCKMSFVVIVAVFSYCFLYTFGCLERNNWISIISYGKSRFSFHTVRFFFFFGK